MNKLNWFDNTLPKMSVNTLSAFDQIHTSYFNFYVRYDIAYATTEDGDTVWLTIRFPAKKVCQRVESIESGKVIAETYRNKFWNELLDEIYKATDMK